MPDFEVPGPPAAAPAPDELLQTLFDIAQTGFILFRPMYAASGAGIVDLAYERLNPAAQQLLALPERPADSFLTLFPNAQHTGIFAFYCEAFEAGKATRTFQATYQYDGLDGHFHLVARRSGELLVVSFSDANEAPRTAAERALRESQAREQQARAAAERQRGELARVFEQAPVAIAVYRGPRYVIELANPTVCRLWGRRAADIVGLGLFEALPEVAGMGYEELLDGVMATGVPYVARGMEARHEREGRTDTVYWDFVYVPMYEADGRIYGAMVVATEVTEQVEARHKAEQLNLDLEARVQQRTEQAQAALREAENQREQLRTQQHLLSQILGQVPAAIATLAGPEHRLTFFNEAYRQLVAGSAQLGSPVAELMPESTARNFTSLLDQVYTTGQPYQGTELPALLPDAATGQLVPYYLDCDYQALTDGQGRPQGVLAFSVDVTAQVQARQRAEVLQAELLAAAQDRARQREELYQVFEQTPAAILLLREPDHRIEYFNPASERLFPGRQLRGRPIAESQPEAAAQGFVALLDRVYTTGETYFGNEQPLDIMQPDGTPRTHYFNFTYQAYREHGRVVGISVFTYDVSEQVQARQQRETQQTELRRIFEQAPVAIAIMRGPQLVIELANETISAIWGRPPALTVGRPYFEAIPDSAGQGFEAIMGGVVATGEPTAVTEAAVQLDRAHTGRPTQGYYDFVFQPLRDGQNQPTGLIAIGTEVTDQVLARRQVQQLNEELRAANDELNLTNRRLTRTNADLDTFVYTASHDLKTPIANIEGLLLAMRQELPPDWLGATTGHLPRLLELMDHSVARFQQTIAHLTGIAQLQQTDDAPPEAVDLPALVENVRLDLAAALTAAGATLTLDIATCPVVHFAPRHLRSIIFNLLSNAIKYRAPGRPPLVALRATCTATQLTLAVQDNGLGLSEEQQRKLFQLFRRLHTHVEGSGVGLYAVKKIVDNAGGTITVQSELGVGTTFTVVLPG